MQGRVGFRPRHALDDIVRVGDRRRARSGRRAVIAPAVAESVQRIGGESAG
jgi:hypothetical protein